MYMYVYIYIYICMLDMFKINRILIYVLHVIVDLLELSNTYNAQGTVMCTC
jgi:hypothetical protein